MPARWFVEHCHGGHSGGETPGPIPNPEAKPSSADGTALVRVWESRSSPTFNVFTSGPPPAGGGPLLYPLEVSIADGSGDDRPRRGHRAGGRAGDRSDEPRRGAGQERRGSARSPRSGELGSGWSGRPDGSGRGGDRPDRSRGGRRDFEARGGGGAAGRRADRDGPAA